MTTTALNADKAKAKAIDKVLEEHSKDGGSKDDDIIVWPSDITAPPVQMADEDLLGYGDAEPTPRHKQQPRRSSLRGDISNNRRASIGYSGEMTLTLPDKSKVTKRRSITFSDDDTVHSADTYDDCSEEEEVMTRQLWFGQEEYRHIESKIRTIVQDSRHTNERPTWLQEPEETRGLETVLDSSVQEERQNAIHSVLEDQQRQKEMGLFDETSLASIYQYNSMDATLVAAERAQQDEEDVQEYLEPTKQVHKRLQHRRASC